MFEYLSPYLDMFRPRVRKGKPVAHQQTCPICVRTLVNLYRHNGVWKCKKCWDAEEGGGEDSIPPVSIPEPDGMRWPF